jgi:hypothetical protein
VENHEKGDLFVEGKNLELVDDFKYLGTFLKSSSDDFKHRKKVKLGCLHKTPTPMERPRFE